MKIVFLGLSITSSWGNGHATTFRSLIRELSRRGHDVLFLERDVPWYASNRDLPNPPYCRTVLYSDVRNLHEQHLGDVQSADAVIVGSYVPDGVSIGHWVNNVAQGMTAFYDIDTPVTLAKLSRGDYEYLSPDLIPRYDLYLSFTGGRALDILHVQYHATNARPLYCSFDPDLYYPQEEEPRWHLGYMGTYSEDRQPSLKKYLLDVAREYPRGNFVVAGPQYPSTVKWLPNVERIEHLPPKDHRQFYNQQQFTLNLTRADMKRLGYSPSVRLFEAAACGIPIISDYWAGLEKFFELNQEILITESTQDTLDYLHHLSPEQRHDIGMKARQRVLNEHTAAHRAHQLEDYLKVYAS